MVLKKVVVVFLCDKIYIKNSVGWKYSRIVSKKYLVGKL